MLAVLTDNYFSSDQYIYEHKWDGERLIAYKKGKDIKLFSRDKKLLNGIYPTIVNALKDQFIDNFIIDGEVIAYKGNKTNFSILQKRMHELATKVKTDIKIEYQIFDVIYIGNYSTISLDQLSRKIIVKNMLEFKDPLNYTEHIFKDGLEYFHKACKNNWEGVIAKYIFGTYVQKRSKNWLKFKCINEQEFIIIGYTNPHGLRKYFGALLLGYYYKDNLMYAGKVGTGFSQYILKDLYDKFQSIKIKKPLIDISDIKHIDEITWLKPKIVAQIKFTEWTVYNKLRHPRFIGLRDDKDPKDVVKEKARNID
jgi:DNA ligase D-like protein (predicted ligase)